MTYKGTDSIRNRHRKKKTRPGGVFFLGIAFLAFVVIGLSVSLTLRACSHQKGYTQVGEHQYAGVEYKREDIGISEKTQIDNSCEMPDSVALICVPQLLDGVSEQIIRKSSYIVSYNKDTKIPNWVAWHLMAEHTDGPYRRLNNFYEELSVASPRATIDDYKSSGWSRGHMCPAGDNKWDEKAMYDSFSLVNVCPQNASLNSGLWNSIEMDCRRWARKFGGIYIVCGPVFLNQEHETIGANEVVVPEAFFKVVLCLNGVPKALGIICRNTDGNKKRDIYYNSVDQVERITGIDFFPALPDELEDSVESVVDMNIWN